MRSLARRPSLWVVKPPNRGVFLCCLGSRRHEFLAQRARETFSLFPWRLPTSTPREHLLLTIDRRLGDPKETRKLLLLKACDRSTILGLVLPRTVPFTPMTTFPADQQSRNVSFRTVRHYARNFLPCTPCELEFDGCYSDSFLFLFDVDCGGWEKKEKKGWILKIRRCDVRELGSRKFTSAVL